jgi:hypothetical protein
MKTPSGCLVRGQFSDGRRQFHARYRRHDIQVQRESAGRFYIIVTAPTGAYCYDGWWGDDYETRTMEQAVDQAITGSCLRPTKRSARP